MQGLRPRLPEKRQINQRKTVDKLSPTVAPQRLVRIAGIGVAGVRPPPAAIAEEVKLTPKAWLVRLGNKSFTTIREPIYEQFTIAQPATGSHALTAGGPTYLPDDPNQHAGRWAIHPDWPI